MVLVIFVKKFDRDRTRTCNPQIRSLVPYPLGHTTRDSRDSAECGGMERAELRLASGVAIHIHLTFIPHVIMLAVECVSYIQHPIPR